MDLTLTIAGVICLILGIYFSIDTAGEHSLCTGALALVGIILLIIGIISSNNKSINIQQPENLQPQSYCIECGKPIFKDSKFCENCGKELINK